MVRVTPATVWRHAKEGDLQKRSHARTTAIPAAQYIRMSTEHQRFSPDSQKTVIAAYALANGFEVVETYQDSGKSGLSLKGRPELKRLLADVLAGSQTFRTVLVLDVSRWGRFQDADQAAHYEFVCRQAGAPVRYCSEAFDNDGGAMASIVKHMKRVMAAEYSRELSVKIARAQRQQASLGYKQGGMAALGIRRQVIDEKGRPRMILGPGQRKALSTDRVQCVRGPATEVALVQRIFRMYSVEDASIAMICTWLAEQKKLQQNGRAWTHHAISNMLQNEIYIGNYVFGRRCNNLGNRYMSDRRDWVRSRMVDPVISEAQFNATAAKLARTTRRCYPDKELIDGLATLFKAEGFISHSLIRDCTFLPRPEVFVRRFGSLHAACRLIGHEKPHRSYKGGLKRGYSNEELVHELRRILAEKGEITRKAVDEDAVSPRAGYFIRRLGGIRNMAIMAGALFLKMPKAPAHRDTDGNLLTQQTLLECLRKVFAKHGYLAERLIDADPSVPSAGYYRRTFGSIRTAYAMVGYCDTRSEIMQASSDRRYLAGAHNSNMK